VSTSSIAFAVRGDLLFRGDFETDIKLRLGSFEKNGNLSCKELLVVGSELQSSRN